MRVGTKSILFGAHQLLIHPIIVARAWWILYGFPWDPRLWVAFIVHDLGYLGKPNMDGEEGEAHVFLGAKIMGWLFDMNYYRRHDWIPLIFDRLFGRLEPYIGANSTWYCFSFYHSRFMAKRYGIPPSRLCFADKLAQTLDPWWFYVPRARALGEIKEYRDPNHKSRGTSKNWRSVEGSDKEWYLAVQAWAGKWVEEHKGGQADTWTSTPLDYREGESGGSV